MEIGPQNLMYFGNPWQMLLVLLVVLVLFAGKGKVSDFMGDFAKGIKAFKKGLSDDESAQQPEQPAKALDHDTATAQTKPSHTSETKV